MKSNEKHTCCPNEFKDFDDVTGDYCLDGVLPTVKSKDLKMKINMYLNSNDTYDPWTDTGRQK